MNKKVSFMTQSTIFIIMREIIFIGNNLKIFDIRRTDLDSMFKELSDVNFNTYYSKIFSFKSKRSKINFKEMTQQRGYPKQEFFIPIFHV